MTEGLVEDPADDEGVTAAVTDSVTSAVTEGLLDDPADDEGVGSDVALWVAAAVPDTLLVTAADTLGETAALTDPVASEVVEERMFVTAFQDHDRYFQANCSSRCTL